MNTNVNNDDIMRTAWNAVAGAYQDRYEIRTRRIHYGPLCPSEDKLQLLGDLGNRKLLELGSGAGQNSIVAAKSKAVVTAIDISTEQIRYGKKLARDEGVDVCYREGSFLDFCEMGYRNEIDIILSVYALQYCYDVKEMRKVFRAIYSALKPGGRFVFSLDHPIRAHGYWSDDMFIVDKYFDRDQKTWLYEFPESELSSNMAGSFRTVGDYFSALINAGFVVKQIIEPKPVQKDDNSKFGIKSSHGTNSPSDPFSYQHLSRIPGTIIFQAFRPE